MLIHNVYDSDAHFVINPTTRALKNEGSAKTALIHNDHDSERFTFELPAEIEGHKMKECNVVQVHYINIGSSSMEQSKGIYPIEDLQVSPDDPNTLICSWLISGNATKYVGSLNFALHFACVDEETGTIHYAWNTGISNVIKISDGIYNSDAVAEEYVDILQQWWAKIFMEKGGTVDENIMQDLRFWIGSMKEFQSLSPDEIPDNRLHIFTDDPTLDDINQELDTLGDKIDNIINGRTNAGVATDVADTIDQVPISDIFENDGKTVKKATHAEHAIDAGYTMGATDAENLTGYINQVPLNEIFEDNVRIVKNATNVNTSIGGEPLTDIFETDGVTVKNATDAANVAWSIDRIPLTDIFEDDGMTVKHATNVTEYIGEASLDEIFEDDGTTVKKATYASNATGPLAEDITALQDKVDTLFNSKPFRIETSATTLSPGIYITWIAPIASGGSDINWTAHSTAIIVCKRGVETVTFYNPWIGLCVESDGTCAVITCGDNVDGNNFLAESKRIPIIQSSFHHYVMKIAEV